MSDKKILSFTIGPVQGFISQARKTKDSFSGSKILSDVVNETMKNLDEEQIILPKKDIESKPNRFIALVDANFDEKDILEQFENKAKLKYRQIAEATYRYVFNNEKRPIGFDEQIMDFLNIHWVVSDYRGIDYKRVHNELDSLMGAIKNTQMYPQIKFGNVQVGDQRATAEFGERGRKCTICGERNGIFYGQKPKGFFNPLFHRVIHNHYMSKNEGLCAVCFTKRFYENEKTSSFPSTAELSLMNITSNDLYKELNQKYNSTFSVDLLYV